MLCTPQGENLSSQMFLKYLIVLNFSLISSATMNSFLKNIY